MSEAVFGLILAGGQARRMGGGDKPLLPLGGRPMLAHVIARLRPQVAGLLLSANGDPARFAPWAVPAIPMLPDSLPGQPGPLAGILAGLDWLAERRDGAGWLLSVPGDTPFIPADLAARLRAARVAAGTPLACARSGGRLHPAVGLWPVALRDALRRALLADERKVAHWTARHGCAEAEWPGGPADPFFNANTPEELAEAEARLAREG